MMYSAHLWAGRTVGLLGGSFNPAHEGHLHISLYALRLLGLDAVWWMVSPQNPMKSRKDMAPLDERLAGARIVADHPRIHVTDIERQMGTRYTIDTLEQLRLRFPTTRFVWLMGMDNLLQFHRWHGWEEIFRTVPIAVLDRPPRPNTVKTSPTGERFRPWLLPQEQSHELKTRPAPAWTILRIPLNAQSATQIRERRKLRNIDRSGMI